MKAFISIFFMQLGVALFSGIPYSSAAESTNNGTLTFVYDLDEGQCTIPVENGYQLAIRHGDIPTPEQPCKGHSIRYIKFNGVRSAVSVWLASEHDSWGHAIGCDYLDKEPPNNFLIELRTVKNIISSVPIGLDSLKREDVGMPVAPGVKVKSWDIKDPNDVNRELSCIRIKFD